MAVIAQGACTTKLVVFSIIEASISAMLDKACSSLVQPCRRHQLQAWRLGGYVAAPQAALTPGRRM